MAKFIIAALGVALVLTLLIAVRVPRADRDWEEPLSRAPEFSPRADGLWRLHDLRAFEFAHYGLAVQEDWRDVIINPADLKEVWFFVEPFEGFSGAAHTLISFAFGGETNQTIAISVEARKEKGETYSSLAGVLSAYELIYLWSTEKDVLTRIAVGLDHDIYAYRLHLSKGQAQEIFSHFIARTNALAKRPRFYNTLTSNCTNELAKAVNGAYPGALPWHYSHILTGFSAERLHQLGFVAREENFSATKIHALALHAIQRAAVGQGGDFSADWRKAMAREYP